MTPHERKLVEKILKATVKGEIVWKDYSSAYMSNRFRATYKEFKLETLFQRDENPKLFIDEGIMISYSSRAMFGLIEVISRSLSTSEDVQTKDRDVDKKKDNMARLILAEMNLEGS